MVGGHNSTKKYEAGKGTSRVVGSGLQVEV